MTPSKFREFKWLPLVVAGLLCIVAVGRVVSTYRVFCQTWDEPVHVGSGMGWLQEHSYSYEDLHPPLARIAVAIAPFVSGIRLTRRELHPDVLVAGGNAVFAANGAYLHNLALARAGVIPFFVLTVAIIWCWTQKLFGAWTATAAVGLFTLLPPVLGHSGLATTDVPVMATVFLASFAFWNWLLKPSIYSGSLLGLCVGLAVLSKFSALLFLPACFFAIFSLSLRLDAVKSWVKSHELVSRTRQLSLGILVCCLLILACYQFSYRPVVAPSQRPHQFLDRIFGNKGTWHDISNDLVEKIPVPVPEFFHGLGQARGRVTGATNMYLLGQVQTTGWWYFFLVAILVKTPIPFLILIFVGIVGTFADWFSKHLEWGSFVPIGCAVAILLVCLPTKFNIGLRHILPIYPLLSIVAGYGCVWLICLQNLKWLARLLALGLVGSLLVCSVAAHPDYLAYFNAFAGDHPEKILVDSDLDWGQDLLRLSAELRSRGITEVAVAYNGGTDLSQMNLPAYQILPPCKPATGWVAISLLKLEMSKPGIGCGGYSWLQSYEPAALVGKSIRLYWIPAH